MKKFNSIANDKAIDLSMILSGFSLGLCVSSLIVFLNKNIANNSSKIILAVSGGFSIYFLLKLFKFAFSDIKSLKLLISGSGILLLSFFIAAYLYFFAIYFFAGQ